MIIKNIDKQGAMTKHRRSGEAKMTKILAAAAMAVLLSATPALAQNKIQIGCTATSDCASAMLAIDEGVFKKHGIEAEMVLIGINSNIPAAILSNSIQIGGPTSTVFLQAADGGLDLVAIGGASVMSPVTNSNIPTMMDIMKSGSVDAVLTGEPFVTRMTNAGLGSVGARYAAELNRTEPIIFYAASREWAEKNPEVVKKFRAAVAETAPVVNDDREKASASISKFSKQPIELVKATPPNRSEPILKPEQLAWWIDIMSSQKMLQSKLDLNKLILK
jgi:NitT/TauT family transport system substrate-binding protein